MHDHRVANHASYPHEQPLLHPPLHPPGGASLHPPRTLSPESLSRASNTRSTVCLRATVLHQFLGIQRWRSVLV